MKRKFFLSSVCLLIAALGALHFFGLLLSYDSTPVQANPVTAEESAETSEKSVEIPIGTIVVQAGGLNSEGYHPSFVAHGPTQDLARAFAAAYDGSSSGHTQGSEYLQPEKIQVLVPDTMSQGESQVYLEYLRTSFAGSRATLPPLVLVSVPVKELVSEANWVLMHEEDISISGANSETQKRERRAFYERLRDRIVKISTWAHNMKNWREYWSKATNKERDNAMLLIFGIGRAVPGVCILGHDAGINPINIFRMIVSFAADVFFTVAPQKLAQLPEKMRIPKIGDWFNKNTELKAFLFNYSMSLGIPLGFLNLGYLAKGGAASGETSPWDPGFLLEFAGLQGFDALMGTFSSRGARVLAEKGYLSGRHENAIYFALNLLGQGQGLSAATANPGMYMVFLFSKNILQGMLYFMAKVLPAKTPQVRIFHPSISERDRASILYKAGILEPGKLKAKEDWEQKLKESVPGPNSVSRVLGSFGDKFVKSQEAIKQGGGLRCVDLL